MPLYEYRCDSCDKVLEVMQKFTDAPLQNCPECGSAVEKLISRNSFQLKGSGWYVTDYKKGSSSGSESKSESKSDSGKAESKNSKPTKGGD